MITHQAFPDLSNADDDGLLAMGGDLSVNTLVNAYAQGIFPWFNEGQPILWWSPDPRLVLYPEQIKISRSLKKSIKKQFRVTCNEAFPDVIKGCALRSFEGNIVNQSDAGSATWITKDMHEAYISLHRSGYAHSIEVWHEDQLVGGLYGVCLGKVFFGESMFSRKTDASKIALVYLSQHLLNLGFELIDCQVASNHLLTLGAVEIPRDKFMSALSGIDINRPSLRFSDNFPNQSEDLIHCFESKVL